VDWETVGPKALDMLRQYVRERGIGGAQPFIAQQLAASGVTVSRLNNYLRYMASQEWAAIKREAGSLAREPDVVAPATADEVIDKRVLARARKGPVAVMDLADDLDVPPSRIRDALVRLETKGTILNVAKDTVVAPLEPRAIEEDAEIEWSGNALTFCAVSDTHLGSKYEQVGPLNAIYDLCAERGIRDVFHSGDLVDGQKMYRGQTYEIAVHGADDQKDYAIAVYPRRDGVRTHIIAGNHDWSFFKDSGFDLVKAVADARDDFTYYGPIGRMIDLRCPARRRQVFRLHLLHPSGGAPYASSYRLQKTAESYAGGDKPDMALVGHLHIECMTFVRNIYMVQMPCFQRQTPYLKAKPLDPVVGARFFRVEFSKDGAIGRVGTELLTWYVPEGAVEKAA